jgi:Chitobiase/beta-hexosaminidase C-terminal domain/Bacterial Ig-like domain (group 2)
LNKFISLMVFSMGVPAPATTCTVQAGSSAATIQGIANTAGLVLKRLLLLLGLTFCAMHAHASCTTPITAGMTNTEVQTALNSCSSGSTAAFPAGTYTFTASVDWPCGVSITSPSATFGTSKPVTINWTGSGAAFNYPSSCSVAGVVFQGIEVAASPASRPGGGAIYLGGGGGAGPTIRFNYLHGIQGDGTVNYSTDYSEIYVDGNGSGSSVMWTGLNILWNVLGTTGGGDCAEYMDTFFYGGTNYNNAGGFCAGVNLHSSTTNLTIEYNKIQSVEEGFKFQENPCGCQGTGGNQFMHANANVMYNDFSGIHRIAIEAQDTPNPTMNFNYNDWHDATNPGYGSWLFSLPQYDEAGYSYTDINTNMNYNVFVSNVPAATLNGVAGEYVPGNEFWGTGEATYNLIQGSSAACGVQFGFGNVNWSLSNNQYQGSGQVVCNEEKQTTNSNPAETGNTSSSTIAAVTSVAPTISPGGGTFSGSHTITFTNPGQNRDVNTGIWYTTDGSTPVPGAGTAQYASSGGTIPITSTTTVKAVGMWGAANQPTSYPAGYGYIPSSVISAVYTTSGGSPVPPTPTGVLNDAYLATPNNVNTMVVGGTLQFDAVGNYGTSPVPVAIPASQVVWSSSNPAVLTVNSSGLVTAVGAGKANVQDQIGTVTGNPWTITATGKSLTSAYLRPKSGANTMTTGSTMQLIAYATYSDGTTGTLPDAQGNVVTWWNTTNHAVAKISSLGHATALATGSINMEAMVNSLNVSPWPVTVKASTAAVQAAPASAIRASTAANTDAAAVPAVQSALTALTPGSGPAAPGAALPDTFLGPFWSLVTPAGGSASISNSHLFLGVPGGGNHDPLLPSNQAVRVVQTIGNEDFDVAIKIDSPLLATDGNTSQGLMVLSDSEDFITFALATDGTKIGLSAHMITGGRATTVLDDTDFSQYQNPMYLRVTKAGSAYVAFYSVDGANWTEAASFTDTTIFTSIGPFASNYNDIPANAAPVVMSLNWFDVH